MWVWGFSGLRKEVPSLFCEPILQGNIRMNNWIFLNICASFNRVPHMFVVSFRVPEYNRTIPQIFLIPMCIITHVHIYIYIYTIMCIYTYTHHFP